MASSKTASPPLRHRVAALAWAELAGQMAEQGYARTPPLLNPEECQALAALDAEPSRFRKRIDMARHRFGEGTYGYFQHPLPAAVSELREALYPRLVPIANGMMKALGSPTRYPPRLRDYLEQCHAEEQTRPTPLLLRYGPGGYNCLHQDLYGNLHFPLQVVLPLSRRGRDYEGGEFLLVENRPRQQARGQALALEQGELLIFPVRQRPVAGKRGMVRATMRHGVSTITCGERLALGIIFHDAR